MTDIQERLLDLLLEIDEICKEHGITYYIDGGTTLGAVRHRGFLPWDDDADIMFTRENWLKFEKAVRENPRPNRVIEGMHNCPDYTMVYARYCATDTTCILRTSMIDQFRSGLFIDLFILDPIPDTPESRKEYFDILYGYCEYLNPFYYDTIIGVNEWYDKFRKMGAEQGRQAVIDFVEKKLFSYPDELGMTYGFRYDNGLFIYPRDVVGKPVYVPFENTFLPVAERVEDYLRIHYGDNWHMIPPVGQEEGHNVVIDLNVPYDQFKNSYMDRINRPQAIKTYEKLHQLRTEHRRATQIIDTTNYSTAAKLFARMLSVRDAREERPMKELLAAGEYSAVRQMLSNYYDMQLNRWFLYYKVFVPLEDQHLWCALYLMLMDGLYSKADKILTLRKEQNEALSEDLVQIESLIADIRDVVRAFERNDLERALELSSRRLEEHPDIPQFLESSLRARAKRAYAGNDARSAMAVMKEIEKPENDPVSGDRLRAAYYFLALRFGESDTQQNALQELRKLMESSSDGMLRLEIMDELNVTLAMGEGVEK